MYTALLDATILAADQRTAILALAARLDLAPGPGGSRITDFGALQPALLDLLGPAYAATYRAAIVALYPSSQLVAHTDPPIPGTRLHIPLEVNDRCWVLSGDRWQQLALGCVYLMDPTELHGAVNWGATRRLHLLLDTH